MVPYYPGYPDRTKLVNYLVAMIKTANEYNGIYATSANKEGNHYFDRYNTSLSGYCDDQNDVEDDACPWI